jgi:hypothetical protein
MIRIAEAGHHEIIPLQETHYQVYATLGWLHETQAGKGQDQGC